MTTEAIPAALLVVDVCADTEALLERAGLDPERISDATAAIERVEAGEPLDVIVLGPRLEDPVRVAQRLHSLDKQGAIVILAAREREADVRHALEVAPFLAGDVSLATIGDPGAFAELLIEAANRTRVRRAEAAALKKRRDTPPGLSARYLGTLLDSAPIGIVTLDDEGAVVGWNKRTGKMLGVPEVDALGAPFASLWDEADRERMGSLIESLGSAGIAGEGEVFERGGRAFEVTGARFAIRSGAPGTLLILQDVSARVTAVRELELQRALLAAQAESAVAGIAVVTLDGRLERMNHRWTEIWGVDAEMVRTDREHATKVMMDQVEDPAEFIAGTERLAATDGGEYSDEVRLKDGRTIERYAAHVRSETGEIVGRVWFHTDITERRRAEDALRFLADATDMLSSSLDYETTLERVASLAVPKIADWCTVEMVEEGRDHRGEVARAIQTGESQLYAQDSGMVVPIKLRGRVFGAISFTRNTPGRSFDADDLKLAEEMARRAGIAIDNSRVHAELRDTARTLQESLLPPQLPAIEGVELAARFRPAGAGMQVGGDFYDIFDAGEKRWCIAVGDVCGKGADAATLTAMTRYTVRVAASYEDSASGVLGVLNRSLLHQRGDFRFTTLAFCVLDLSDEGCTLTAALGGHPRPLLLRADGSAEAVGAAGPLLGVIPDATFAEEGLSLSDGDVVVLYTDGLTDAHAPARTLEEADLIAALKECAGFSAGEVAQQMEEVALGGSDAAVRDDIAVLVLKLGD